jgi:dCMP deaminase
MRKSVDEYFMAIAKTVSTRSTCLRRNVGAVIVRKKRIITTGYNGAPSGLGHCVDRGCLREELNVPSGERDELCRAVHAEMNAIIQAAVHGVSTSRATIYVTTSPCLICAKAIINADIDRVVCAELCANGASLPLFDEAGIAVDAVKIR